MMEAWLMLSFAGDIFSLASYSSPFFFIGFVHNIVISLLSQFPLYQTSVSVKGMSQ